MQLAAQRKAQHELSRMASKATARSWEIHWKNARKVTEGLHTLSHNAAAGKAFSATDDNTNYINMNLLMAKEQAMLEKERELLDRSVNYYLKRSVPLWPASAMSQTAP